MSGFTRRVEGNALLDHVWGASPAQDRIWAHVAGMRPDRAVRRPMMVLQAFVDDSYERGGWYVLAGFISTAERWASFSKDWEELLPLAPLNKHGRREFKMSNISARARDDFDLRPWIAAVRRISPVPISCSVSFLDIEQAATHFSIPGAEIEWPAEPTALKCCLHTLVTQLTHRRDRFLDRIPLNEPIEFIFDETGSARSIAEMWAATSSAETRRLLSSPRFESGEVFMPLQAADMLAWSTRTSLPGRGGVFDELAVGIGKGPNTEDAGLTLGIYFQLSEASLVWLMNTTLEHHYGATGFIRSAQASEWLASGSLK